MAAMDSPLPSLQPLNSTAPLLAVHDASTAPPGNPWLLHPRRQQAATAPTATAVNLVCIPPAGCGAWPYAAWSEGLAPHVQVLPVELPGHGTRIKEPCCTDLVALSRQAVDALTGTFTQGPYALFGHSMGAWVAWEMLQELTRRGLPLPVKLFVSGNRAPSLCGAAHDVDAGVAMHQLPSAEFWARFEQRYGHNATLADPQVRAFMLPMLRSDFTALETYQPSAPGIKTVVPIVAIGGQRDTRINPQQMAAWAQHTTGGCTEVWLHNVGHSYIADGKPPSSVLTVLRSQLAPPKQPRQHHHQALQIDTANGAAAADAGATARPLLQRRPPLWRRCCCCCLPDVTTS